MSEPTGWSPELGVLRVATPCAAKWEQMKGDARVRFCGLCRLNVYDLSALTTDEARRLLLAKEGRLCVRFYRRADGRLLNQDCPRGLAARLRRRWAAALATVMALLGVVKSATHQAGCELPGPPPATPIPHAETKPPAAADERWMAQRRSLLGGWAQQPVQGKLYRNIVLIRGERSR